MISRSTTLEFTKDNLSHQLSVQLIIKDGMKEYEWTIRTRNNNQLNLTQCGNLSFKSAEDSAKFEAIISVANPSIQQIQEAEIFLQTVTLQDGEGKKVKMLEQFLADYFSAQLFAKTKVLEFTRGSSKKDASSVVTLRITPHFNEIEKNCKWQIYTDGCETSHGFLGFQTAALTKFITLIQSKDARQINSAISMLHDIKGGGHYDFPLEKYLQTYKLLLTNAPAERTHSEAKLIKSDTNLFAFFFRKQSESAVTSKPDVRPIVIDPATGVDHTRKHSA